MSILGGSKHPPAKGKDDKDDDKAGNKRDGSESEDKHPSDESRIAGDKRTTEGQAKDGVEGSRDWDNINNKGGPDLGKKPGVQEGTGSMTQNEPNARPPESNEMPPQQDPADASTLNHPLTPRIVGYARLANDSFDELAKLEEEMKGATQSANTHNQTRYDALWTAFEGKFRNLVDLCMGDNVAPETPLSQESARRTGTK